MNEDKKVVFSDLSAFLKATVIVFWILAIVPFLIGFLGGLI